LFALFVLLVTVLAYEDLLPKDTLRKIPHYDSIGHFVLFGMYAYLAQNALKGKKLSFMPIGASAVALYAIVDEFLQRLSPNRSFDLWDLFFSLCGILAATSYKDVLRYAKPIPMVYKILAVSVLILLIVLYGEWG
jgi:glycopeptide antibiotics resistance protein